MAWTLARAVNMESSNVEGHVTAAANALAGLCWVQRGVPEPDDLRSSAFVKTWLLQAKSIHKLNIGR